MKVHRVKATAYPGTDFEEVYPPTRKLYNRIKAQTKRQPYVRAAYFNKEKVFIELFWIHLNQKNQKERRKRLKYYACGIELLRSTKRRPATRNNPNKSAEYLHRFAGVTIAGDMFYIQVKENRRTGRKDFMSVFPAE